MNCCVCGKKLHQKTAFHFKFWQKHYHLCFEHACDIKDRIDFQIKYMVKARIKTIEKQKELEK